VVVIGVGNALRHDDDAGLEVARRLRALDGARDLAVREHELETLGLLEAWEGYGAAVIVDAIHSGARAGTLYRVDASEQAIPTEMRSSSSTHAVDVAGAIELARTLHRIPARVILHGVEGQRFDAGSGLSEPVRAAIAPLLEAVLRDARRLSG